MNRGSAAGGGALLILAVYLIVVFVRGNMGVFASAFWNDFAGGKSNPHFWQWAVALVVLYAIGQIPETEHIFGPLLAIVLVAMLIQLAMKQPQLFNTLTNNVTYLFGGGTIYRS